MGGGGKWGQENILGANVPLWCHHWKKHTQLHKLFAYNCKIVVQDIQKHNLVLPDQFLYNLTSEF